MNADPHFSEEDKTRIRSIPGEPPAAEEQHTPPPSALDLDDRDKTVIGPGVSIGHAPQQPPSPPPEPTFSENKTIIAGEENHAPTRPAPPSPPPPPPPQMEDDLLFVAELASGITEVPLSSGVRMTVGRSNDQNIILDDKTLSRQHLILERSGDRVKIQVIGLNGMVHNRVTHKSTTVEIAAPATFTVGRVLCRLRKKIDVDATLFMANPAELAQGSGTATGATASPAAPSPQPQQDQPGNFQSPPPSTPFSDQEKFPGDYDSETGNFQSASFLESAQEKRFDDFDGKSSFDDPFSGQQSGLGAQPSSSDTFFSNKKHLFIAGGIAVVVLVAVIIFMVGGKSTNENLAPPQPPIRTVPRAEQTAEAPASTPAPPVAQVDTKNYNLHSRFYNEAYRYYNEKNFTMACDYLKDIPSTSAFRERAENLSNNMADCDLND